MKSSGASKGSIPRKPSKVIISRGDSAPDLKWLRYFKFARLLIMFAGVLLMLTGLTLVTLSMIGMIQPQELSYLVMLLGSVATMTGLYLLYDQVQQRHSTQQLLKSAIERVYRSQN